MRYLAKGGAIRAEERAMQMRSVLDVFQERQGRQSGFRGRSQLGPVRTGSCRGWGTGRQKAWARILKG